MADPSTITDDTTDLKTAVRDSIKFRYATLKGALEGSMKSFAGELYQADLINGEAMKCHNYDVIMSQFISGMDFKHTISELQEHCQLFTDVLEKLGGAAKMASSEFTKEWNISIPQQQCSVVRSEATVPESNSHQGMLSLIFNTDNNINILIYYVDEVKFVSPINKFPTRELASKARRLKMKFYNLLSAIEESSKQKNVEKFKFHVQVLLTDAQESPQLTTTIHYLNEVKQLATSSDILLFLKTHGFIGYQNYELLQYIVGCLLKDDLQVVAQMDEYIKKYEDFEQELSLNQLEEISHEEDLHPIAPSGLPEFNLRANGDTNVHKWRKTYSEKFPWSNRTLLKNINPGSVILTYVALPCIVSDVLRDLTDPVILRELESMEVTVVFLPQPSQTSEVTIFTVKSIL